MRFLVAVTSPLGIHLTDGAIRGVIRKRQRRVRQTKRRLPTDEQKNISEELTTIAVNAAAT